MDIEVEVYYLPSNFELTSSVLSSFMLSKRKCRILQLFK